MRRLSRSLIVLSISLGWWLSAHTGLAQTRPPAKLAIAYGSINVHVSPVWVARERGFFVKHGINPEASFIVAGQAAQAMLAGDVQVGIIGPTHVVSAVAAGGDFVILMGLKNQMDYLFIAKGEIKSPQDLKGKKVGIATPAGAASLAVHLSLDRFGLDARRDQITLVNAGGEPERFAAFLSGAIDATVLAPEFLEKLKGRPYTLLLDLRKAGVPWQQTALVVRRSYLKANAAPVEGTMKALLEAIAFIHNPGSKPAVLKTIAKELKLSTDEQAEAAYRELIEGVPKRPYPTRDGIASAIQLMSRLKLNPRAAEVKVDDVVDLEPLRQLEPFMESLLSPPGITHGQ